MSNQSAQIDYVVRVNLPSSAGYHSGPSGDTEYERDYNDAIFKTKPEGFEVSWSTQNLWPRDKDGKTWVLLYCTDQKKAVEFFNDKIIMLQNKIAEYQRLITELNKI